MKKLIYLISFILPVIAAAQSIKPGSIRIPEYSTTARNSANLQDGSIIINTDSAKMQLYLGGTWYTLAASSGGSSGAQTLSYGQYATADTMTISGGNKVALPTATSSVAGQLDTGHFKTIDSLRNRTISGFGLSGMSPGYLPYAASSSSVGNSGWYYNQSTGESILSNGSWASHFYKSGYFQLRDTYIALVDSGGGAVGISTTSSYNSGVLNIAGTTSVNGSLYLMNSGANVGSLIGSGTTLYVDSRVSSGSITFRTNNTNNTALQLLPSGTAQFFTPTTSAASVNFPGGATPTSPNDGDVWNNSSTHHLFARLNGTTYQLDQQSGAANYQTVQAAGTNKTQRANLNLLYPFTATDNSGNSSTDIGVDITTASSAADSVVTETASSGALNRTSIFGVMRNAGVVGASSNTGSFATANCSGVGTAHFLGGNFGSGSGLDGYVTLTVTAANTLTQAEIYPGISTVTAVTDVIGSLTAWNNTSTGNVAGYCSGVTADNGVLLSFYPTATGSYTVYFHFSEIIH